MAIIKALTIGITNDIAENDWKLFRRTGTIHLLVISGAHIGFVAGLIFLITKFLWSRSSGLCLWLPSMVFGSICGICSAIIYAMLAGLSVSVQRALFACFFVFSKNFIKVKFSNWQIWRLGLISCLIYEPHYILYPGFFLSFIAVAVIFIASRFFQGGKYLKTFVIQFACLLGLLPFTLYWFNYASLTGFFANLVAIPLVGFLIVPLALLLTLTSLFTNFLYLHILVNKLIDYLFWYLNYIDKISKYNIELFLPIYATLSLLMIMGICLLYPLKSLKVLLFCLIVCFLLPKAHTIKTNKAQIDVLDVGQGLSVLIRTSKHILLYDTGGKFYQGKDMGELVILPYLKTLRVQKLDMVIISHPNINHRGGLETIQKTLFVDTLVINHSFKKKPSTKSACNSNSAAGCDRGPVKFGKIFNCHYYPRWNWDGVEFQFLPINKKFRKKNNNSCVLLIKSAQQSMLLTGDIEQEAEKYLLKKYAKILSVDYLVVPHHGSKTSSSLAFLKMVNPKSAIFSYGNKNKYNFPSKNVVKTYSDRKVKIFSTAQHGMIKVIF